MQSQRPLFPAVRPHSHVVIALASFSTQLELGQLPPHVKIAICTGCSPLSCLLGALLWPLAFACWQFSLRLKPRLPGTGRRLAAAAIFAQQKHCPQAYSSWLSTVCPRPIPRIQALRLSIFRQAQPRGLLSQEFTRATQSCAIIFRFSLQLISLPPLSSALRQLSSISFVAFSFCICHPCMKLGGFHRTAALERLKLPADVFTCGRLSSRATRINAHARDARTGCVLESTARNHD